MKLLNKLSSELFYTDEQLKEIPIQDYYCKLPNGLFYSKVDGEVGIIKLLGSDKPLPILEYLYINTNRKNVVEFTLESLIVACGFEPNRNKDKANDQFKNILEHFQQLHIISSEVDMNKIKPKQSIVCSLVINLESHYISLFDSEKAKILNQVIDKVDNLKLLIYYCYIKCRIYKRSKKDGDLVCNGGRAEVTWVSYTRICNDLGLSDETIAKYNNILVELDLIRIGSAGNWYYKDDKNIAVRESSNIYTLWSQYQDVWETNIKEGIKYYKMLPTNADKVFTGSKEYKNNNHKLNGELGSLIKKQKSKSITKLEKVRLNEIINSKTMEDKTIDEKLMDIKVKIQSLNQEELNNFKSTFKNVRFSELKGQELENVIARMERFYNNTQEEFEEEELDF